MDVDESSVGYSQDSNGDNGNSGEEVLCFCGGHVRSDDYVQCETCETWQHFECVGFNPISERNRPYTCPLCAEDKAERTDVGATLIVCPDTILNQWLSEIRKHVLCHLLRIPIIMLS